MLTLETRKKLAPRKGARKQRIVLAKTGFSVRPAGPAPSL
jgi:hypothetical protein